MRRLTLFQSQNEDDITVLNYFDEFEIHPVHFGMYINFYTHLRSCLRCPQKWYIQPGSMHKIKLCVSHYYTDVQL